MKFKIVLDDRRPIPDKYHSARSYEECVVLLKRFKIIEFISLDYDLGTDKTGYDVLEFLLKNGNEVEWINIHSDHSEGVPKMREFVREKFPNVSLSFNPIK